MESDRKNITILMTTYNCAPYIGLAIKSILNQTFRNFELLIIDDGSTDNTSEVVNSFNDNRIVYEKTNHVGRSKALNFGLSIAKYDWISIMDADDIAHPFRLEKQIAIISGDITEVYFTDAAYFKKNRVLFTVENNFGSDKINEILVLHGHFTNSTFLFNKKHILNYGGYDENLDVFEDYDLWLRLKDNSHFKFVNEILQFQRIRNNSLMNSKYQYLNNKLYMLQEPYYKDLRKSFNIEQFEPQIETKAWREFFYGNKNLARKYWNKLNLNSYNFRIVVAYLLSYLPESILNWIKRQKIKLRLNYFRKINTVYKNLDREFNTLLKEIT